MTKPKSSRQLERVQNDIETMKSQYANPPYVCVRFEGQHVHVELKDDVLQVQE